LAGIYPDATTASTKKPSRGDSTHDNDRKPTMSVTTLLQNALQRDGTHDLTEFAWQCVAQRLRLNIREISALLDRLTSPGVRFF